MKSDLLSIWAEAISTAKRTTKAKPVLKTVLPPAPETVEESEQDKLKRMIADAVAADVLAEWEKRSNCTCSER